MKILIIRLWPTYMDVVNNVYNVQEVGLAKALTRRGNTVDILFWTDKEEHDVTLPVGDQGTIHVFYRRCYTLGNNVWYRRQDKLMKQYDILQPAEYNSIYAWHLAARYPEKTVIYHGPYYSPFNRNYNRLYPIFDFLCAGRYRRLKTTFLTKSTLASEFLKEKGFDPSTITAVGVGLDAELLMNNTGETSALAQRLEQETDALKLLYIGRIEPRRAPFFTLDVLRQVLASGQKAKLVIIGDGNADYVEQVRQYIKDSNLEQDILWEKKMPQKQLREIYNMADFFLLPTAYEIFGMVLLEAMYFGRIALTTMNGGSSMLIRDGENGVILPTESPKAWADAIVTLAYDPARRAAMESAAQATIREHFTWDILADTFISQYKMLLEGSRNS